MNQSTSLKYWVMQKSDKKRRKGDSNMSEGADIMSKKTFMTNEGKQ